MPPPGGLRTSISYQLQNKSAWGPFSPGTPLQPVVQQPVRGWDFPVNVNANMRPRAFEPFGFPQLRAFSNVELVRMAIETRKDQIERMDWQIKPIDGKKAKLTNDGRIKTITAFLAKPDGSQTFAAFIRALLEDLLSIDAATVEMRRSRGGKLIGLEYVPGDTIHPMVDDTGRRPRDPTAIAYQQVVKGVVWANLTNRDILYIPRNVRPGHNYGFSPTEQMIVTINTIIRRQAAQLSHFTESNVPAGLLTAPDSWDLPKIVELQQWMDDKIAGNASEQAKIVWAPAGTKYQAFKDSPIKDEFDEWLARMVAFAFSLPPTPFIRQMNKGTASADQDRALEEGLQPLKLWAKRWIDGVIQTELDGEGLEFSWVDTPSIDPAEQASIDDKNLRNLSATIDEVRDARGQDPLPNGMGKFPLVITSTGAMTLEQVLQAAEDAASGQDGIEEPPLPQHVGEAPADGQPPEDVPSNEPAPKKTAKLAKATQPAPISPTRPKARRATASAAKDITAILAKAADIAAADAAKRLTKLGKEDTGRSNDKTAFSIASAVDLGLIGDIGDAIEEDILDIAADSGSLALAQIGVSSNDQLTNRVYQRAVDYARERAAELVSIDGEDSLIATTREVIRNLISGGLERNIGADAIADSIQESQAFSPQRAELIARTEIANANGQGKGAGWKEAQAMGLVITKAWQTPNDDNTCLECTGNEDAGEIALDDAFPSGDDFEPAHPGCQCVTVATAASGDADTAEN